MTAIVSKEVEAAANRIRTAIRRIGISMTSNFKDDMTEKSKTLADSVHFNALLDKIQELHDRKGADYGSKTNSFDNVRASAEYGIAPWISAVLRANDKRQRIRNFIDRGDLKNEPIEDSLLDSAVYHMIAYLLFLEEQDRLHELVPNPNTPIRA